MIIKMKQVNFIVNQYILWWWCIISWHLFRESTYVDTFRYLRIFETRGTSRREERKFYEESKKIIAHRHSLNSSDNSWSYPFIQMTWSLSDKRTDDLLMRRGRPSVFSWWFGTYKHSVWREGIKTSLKSTQSSR